MRQLVRSGGGDVVDDLRIAKVCDESGGLRIGNGAGESLRVIREPRILDDPHMLELVRAEVRLIIVVRCRQRVEHTVDVPCVRRMIVHGEIDTRVLTTLLGVAGRLDRELVANWRLRHETRDASMATHYIRN